MKTKDEIRKEISELVRNIPADERRVLDETIARELLKRDFMMEGDSICIYVSTDLEVDTHCLIRRLLELNKTVIVPYLEGDTMKVSQIQSYEDLSRKQHNIRIPENPVEYQGEIDVIIVPGVAFDIRRNRLGRGSAHYDNFFKSREAGLKVGLAYEEQIFKGVLPVEPHDVAMDRIQTEVKLL